MDSRVTSLKRWAIKTEAAILLIAATLPVLGCGGSSNPTAHLSGKVTIRGKAIPSDAQASLQFYTQIDGEELKVDVPINTADGTYDSPKTPQGDIRVFFIITREGPAKMSSRTGQEYHDTINLVPPKYSTGLPLTVSEDNPNQNFDL